MITDAIRVVIPSEAWVSEKNNYMYIGKQYKSWFPDDCFIARGTGRENKERLAAHGIEVHYQHASEAESQR